MNGVTRVLRRMPSRKLILLRMLEALVENHTRTDVAVNTEGRTEHQVEKRIKRQEDVLWFKLLDRFGLPTFFAVILLFAVLRIGDKMVTQMAVERKDNQVILAGFVEALNESTKTLKDVQTTLATQGKAIEDINKKLGISRPTYGKSWESVHEPGSR